MSSDAARTTQIIAAVILFFFIFSPRFLLLSLRWIYQYRKAPRLSFSLPKEVFPEIIKIYVEDLKKALAKKEIEFSYGDGVLELLADKSYSSQYGARNCRRIIQREIEDKAVAAICNRVTPVRSISVKAENGEILLEIE